MDALFALAIENLTTPAVLAFALGLAAALLKSDLTVPEAAAKALSIYLLFAIGFKGGAAVSEHGLDGQLIATLAAGTVLSFALPFAAWGLLRLLTRLPAVDAASIAGHYGSISIVTFVAANNVLESAGIASEGFMVATAAVMEAPAILSALWLAAQKSERQNDGQNDGLLREILLNGSIVLLLGAFAIGAATGKDGLAQIEGFIVAPFAGVLCLFLLDMGLIAGRSLAGSRGKLSPGVLAFGLIMPPLGALAGLGAALLIGLSPGGTMLLMTLSASASYIAVPAAMRVALPEADPGVSLTLSLGVTFPFNLVLGLPLYLALANAATGS